MPVNLDKFDICILDQLQTNAKISPKELSAKINKSPSAINVRIKRLETLGFIKHYAAVFNLFKLNKRLASFTGIQLNINSGESHELFRSEINNIPQVINCYHVNGIFDFLLYIVVTDMKEYHNCLINKISAIKNIGAVHTNIILNELKEENKIDLSDFSPEPFVIRQ